MPILFLSRGQTDNTTEHKQNKMDMPKAEQIETAHLKSVFARLRNKQVALQLVIKK